MFWSKNKKNRYTPAYPSFTMLKWGLRGYILHGHVFLMNSLGGGKILIEISMTVFYTMKMLSVMSFIILSNVVHLILKGLCFKINLYKFLDLVLKV